MKHTKLEQEVVTLHYEVVDFDNRVLREAKITASFPTDMDYVDIVDVLHDTAYDREDCSPTSDDGSYGINNLS